MVAHTSIIRVTALAAFACVALLGGRTVAAAPKPASAPVAVRPVISFDESYLETPDTASGRFSVNARIPLDPADVATFAADTSFDVCVGYFDFSGELGDDPHWNPGDTSATLTEQSWDDSGTVLVAKLRWTPTQLIVRVTAMTGDDIDPIVSDDYSMDDTGRIDDETDAEITFGNADVSWDTVPLAGRVATWTAKGDDWSNVRTHGRAAQ